MAATLYDHVPSRYDDRHLSAMRRIEYRRASPGALPKVAFRPHGKFTIEMGNHDVTFHDGNNMVGRTAGFLEVDHFPYRSAEQFTKKARQGYAAIMAADLPEFQGAHWRAYGKLSDEQLVEVFETWFSVKNPTAQGDLRWSPAPLKP